MLTLLDPTHHKPLKQWQFEPHLTVRIGRADDNQVVLDQTLLPPEFVSLISRHHLTLQPLSAAEWQLTNQGGNGTYINGVPVQQTLLRQKTQFQLARGGPLLEVEFLSAAPVPVASIADPIPSPTPAQLADLQQAHDRLQALLQSVQAQLPPATLAGRQSALTQRQTELQQLQTAVQTELDQAPPDRDSLRRTLQAVLADVTRQQQDTAAALAQLQQSIQAIAQLSAHLQANQTIAQQLPPTAAPLADMAQSIQQMLQDYDQALARVHTLHLAAQAKQIIGF